jgi:hypothetical protein
VRAEDQSVYASAIVSTRGHVIGSEAELYYFSFPFDQALVTVFREVCSQRLATLSTALEATLCQFLSQFDHWLVSDTTQFTGTRDFSCSYNAACVRDRTPQAYGEAHSCQDQIYKVCKATVLFNLWEAFVDIFARLLKPLWLELYVLKCQVYRYFVLTVVGVIKNVVSFKNKTNYKKSGNKFEFMIWKSRKFSVKVGLRYQKKNNNNIEIS